MKVYLINLFYVLSIFSVCLTLRIQHRQHVVDINYALDSLTDQIYEVLDKVNDIKEYYYVSNHSTHQDHDNDFIIDEYTHDNYKLAFDDNSDAAIFEKNKKVSEEFVKSVLANFDKETDKDSVFYDDDNDKKNKNNNNIDIEVDIVDISFDIDTSDLKSVSSHDEEIQKTNENLNQTDSLNENKDADKKTEEANEDNEDNVQIELETEKTKEKPKKKQS